MTKCGVSMGFIPMNKKILKKVLERPQVCARRNKDCEGRITIEHVFGRKNERAWNCIFLCERHHSVGAWQNIGLLNKEINRLYAFQQTTEEEIKDTFPKTYQLYLKDKKWLENKYKNLL